MSQQKQDKGLKEQMMGSTETQRPVPGSAGQQKPIGGLEQLGDGTTTTTTTTKVEIRPISPLAQQQRQQQVAAPPSPQVSPAESTPPLTDSPLPQTPLSPLGRDVAPRQPTPQLPTPSKSPAAYHQRAAIQAQTVRFDLPSEMIELSERDAMNQYCRLCFCECPVWMGLLTLTIFSLMVFISFLFWPKTIRISSGKVAGGFIETDSTYETTPSEAYILST